MTFGSAATVLSCSVTCAPPPNCWATSLNFDQIEEYAETAKGVTA